MAAGLRSYGQSILFRRDHSKSTAKGDVSELVSGEGGELSSVKHTSGIARTKLPISAPLETAVKGIVIWSRGFTNAEAAPAAVAVAVEVAGWVSDSDRPDCPGGCGGCGCGCAGRTGPRGCEPRRVVRKRSMESGVIVRCRWTCVGRWVLGSGRDSWRILGPSDGAVSVSVPVSASASGAREGAEGGAGELSESSARREATGGVHSVDMAFSMAAVELENF